MTGSLKASQFTPKEDGAIIQYMSTNRIVTIVNMAMRLNNNGYSIELVTMCIAVV